MRWLQQSTEKIVRIGPAVAVADGFTPVTNLAISSSDEAELLKETGGVVDISGATFAAITTADGWYDLTLTTSHTDTVGDITIIIQDDSLILPLYAYFTVVEARSYKTNILGTDNWFGVNLTEVYRATNTVGSVASLLYEIIAHLGEFSLSGVTKTTKKLDGSTTAKTYTLDSATDPTSITEAT